MNNNKNEYENSNGKKKKSLGIFLIIIGFGVAITYTIVFVKALSELNDKVGFILFSILVFIACLLDIIAGLRTLSNSYSEKHFTKIKKKIYFISIVLLIIIGISIFYLEQAKVTENVEITSVEQFDVEQIQLNNYVYLKDKQIRLKCNQDDYGLLWDYKVVNMDNVKYIITYQWYKFNSSKGKVIKITDYSNK